MARPLVYVIPMSTHSSRRGFLTGFLRPLRDAAQDASAKPRNENVDTQARSDQAPQAAVPGLMTDFMAVVQGRHCLATTAFCRTCLERCPVPDAMKLDHGVPMVVPAACTGCRICHDVCPAPTKAILLVKRPAGMPRPALPALGQQDPD